MSPTLIISNQTTSPAFDRWLQQLAAEIGEITFWCGNASSVKPPVFMQKTAVYHRHSAIARLRSWSAFSWKLLTHLLRHDKGVPLFVVTNPPLMVLVAALLHRWQKRPFILLEWDIYPQILEPMGLAGSRNPLYRLWYHGHRYALRHADRIITISDSMASTLQAMVKEKQLPIHIIPNWVDTEQMRPIARADNAFAQEQAFGDKLVVMYSGNLGATHAIETIIETAVILRDEPDICFVCIGEGSKRPLIENAIATGATPTVRLLPRQPFEQLPLTLAAADVSIVTLAQGYEALSMPSKTYGALAVGNALLGISHQPNDLEQLIETAVCGANFPPTNAAAIADWLKQMNENRETLQQMQEQARKTAVSQFNREQCEGELTAVVQGWLAEKR